MQSVKVNYFVINGETFCLSYPMARELHVQLTRALGVNLKIDGKTYSEKTFNDYRVQYYDKNH